jgi:hemerythrin-like domain-containing protein
METRFNLFTLVHKGLRYALQRLVYSAGRLDVGDRSEVGDFFAEFKRVAVILHRHALDEDNHIQPYIDRFAPEAGRELEQQHTRSEALLARLEEAAALLEGAAPFTNDSERIWLSFVDDLNRFTGDYFLHLYHEESVAMPELWKHMDDAALIAVGNKLRSEIPPQVNAIIQSYMLTAMNMRERYTVLNGVKHTAPAEVFERLCRLAAETLTPAEWEQLKAKLGV